MKKYYLIFLMLAGLARQLTPQLATAAAPAPALAPPPGLVLLELKITGNEFVMLQNNSNVAIADLSRYWLYVFNNVNPLAAGVSSSTQQLPAASLAPGQTVLLSASGGNTCGAAITSKLAVSLNDAGGFLEVVQVGMSTGLLTQTAGDAVSWSSGANPAAGMIAGVPSNSADPNGAWYRINKGTSSAPSFGWQQADVDPGNTCQLSVTVAGIVTPGPLNLGNQLLPGSPPPATIITADPSPSQTDGPALPAADVGLAAPQITELLPNPASPQTDSEDEFIEIYNSNAVPFDLTGFTLEVGTTTVHDYHFPAGTLLPANGWLAFTSIDTGLSLSNSGGQARLLDPFGAVISQSDVYSTAKDGQAWALANGTWYWSTTTTPNAANVINQPLTVQSLSVGTPTAAPAPKKAPATKASTGSVKLAATSTTKPPSSSATSSKATNSNSPPPAPKKASSLHPLVLAGVGSLAVLYALYEYRHDLANRLHQLRRHREIRRIARGAAERR